MSVISWERHCNSVSLSWVEHRRTSRCRMMQTQPPCRHWLLDRLICQGQINRCASAACACAWGKSIFRSHQNQKKLQGVVFVFYISVRKQWHTCICTCMYSMYYTKYNFYDFLHFWRRPLCKCGVNKGRCVTPRPPIRASPLDHAGGSSAPSPDPLSEPPTFRYRVMPWTRVHMQ